MSVSTEFRAPPLRRNYENRWEQSWEVFKRNLPHQQPPFSKREWGGAGHSMCSYQGKMKPALAHHLIECFSRPGEVVVDPFSGAGTIPFEACRMQRRGFGVDISRLGHILTFAKVAMTAPPRVDSLISELGESIEAFEMTDDQLNRASLVRFNSPIPDYFHPETMKEILAARQFFLDRWDSSPEWALLFACTLHLLHGNRPYALSRRSHPVTPFKPTGDFEYRALLPRLRAKIARLSEEIGNPSRSFGGSFQSDTTEKWPEEMPKADAIITSPPFFDSTRFYMANWMRFWFAGWERADFDLQPKDFVETRQKINLDIYKVFFSHARQQISETGVMVMHLGQSPKCDMGSELSNRASPWFNVEDFYIEGVEHCESHGIRDKGTVSGHSYLVLTPL